MGWIYGIGRSATDLEETWWPRIEQHLKDTSYPLPVLMIQSFHPFGDNGSALAAFTPFIDQWNQQGKKPEIVMATQKMWWAAVAEHSHLLPTIRGDWTDYWNFGAGSSARETAINRANRIRLRTADALAAAVLGREQPAKWTARSFALYRDEAWQSLNLWDEHTWGADVAMRLPESEDTASQWHHKAHYAFQARSLSLLLQRDALADFTHLVEPEDADDLLVFNPLPWPREVSGEIPQSILTPRGIPEDTTAGRHYQDRFIGVEQLMLTLDGKGSRIVSPLRPEVNIRAIPPTTVPGYGYAVVKRGALVDLLAEATVSEDNIVENDRYRLTFDRNRGGIISWYDKKLDREWIDESAGYPLHGYVHETVADREHEWPRRLMFEMKWQSGQIEMPRGWKPDWPAERRQPTAVLEHKVIQTSLGIRVVQSLEAPGCQGHLVQSVFLPQSTEYVECESWWEMGQDDHPEATYLLFPFSIPGATARLDMGGQSMEPEKDQLPGTCRDYYTAQQWVDFNNGDFGMTVALPENPMVQLGDFHFGHNQDVFTLDRAMLLGWVTNNYWETNFRAHQPGQVHARYRLHPYQGAFNENQAHRLGLEAAHASLLLQHLGEPRAASMYPQTGTLLHLPGGDDSTSLVSTLHVKPAVDRPGILVRLLNTSDEVQTANIGSGLLQIEKAHQCDLFGTPETAVEVNDRAVVLHLPPRRITTIHLTVT
jgi:hypothetical protein